MMLFGILPLRFADLVDVLLVAVVFYYLFQLFRGTRAVQMAMGMALLLGIWALASLWELHGVGFLFRNLATLGLVALVILFQPELRGALTRVGQLATRFDLGKVFFTDNGLERTVSGVVAAVGEMSRTHRGALIVLERRVGLRNYADTGEEIDARVSARLLGSLFFPNSPLHDGAVILRGERVVAAGCILPLPAVSDTDAALGMRHRAARALAGETDALVVVVSEETGQVSIAYRNTLRRKLTLRELEEELRRHLNELQQS